MKTFKKIVMWLFALLIIMILGIAIFVNTAPQFGQIPQGKDLERIKNSPNYKNDNFVNLIETKLGSFSEMMATLPDFLFGKNLSPKDTLPVKYNLNNTLPTNNTCYITWYGHSSFLIEIEGKRILIDPMFSNHPSPIGFGSARFLNKKEIPLQQLTNIDMVIISHDHYDHLDYKTIQQLKPNVGHFYTALGVGSHLKKWGIDESKITELDWWDSATFQNINLVACPARHFSGRGITDRNKTQWASWIIKSNHTNIYFSGDGGYGPHFKEIGEKFGPFDFAMLECGQYNEAWKDIHMMPEESVQAGIDVQAKLMMPIHWGAFPLSVHPWKDPIERFTKKAKSQKIKYITPYIGERFLLGQQWPIDEWWANKN